MRRRGRLGEREGEKVKLQIAATEVKSNTQD